MKDRLRARRFLIVLGLFFVAIAAYVAAAPENSPEYASLICGFIGSGLIFFGKFGSEKIIKILETLLTGWF